MSGRLCYRCRAAPATCTRWLDHAGRSLCGACAAATDAVPPPPRHRRPKAPPKPPCLPGRAHHWDCPPGAAPLATCRLCGADYQFPAPVETSWLSNPDARTLSEAL